MANKAFQSVCIYILTLVCLVVFISCSQPLPFGDVLLQLSVEGKALETGKRSVGPNNSMIKIAYITVGGYSDSGDSIEEQTFAIDGSLQIKGLSAGLWHISVTGLNSEQLQITEQAFDHNVDIQSGKSTVATFNLQYRNKGTGTYEITVAWPQTGGWFSQVSLSLGDTIQTSVSPERTDTQAVFHQEQVPVGSYDVNLSFTNGSGTKVALPMMDTARIYNSLDSTGEIDLLEFDLLPVSDPVISVDDQRIMTLSSDTGGASFFYTTDGTDPLTSGTKQLYENPVSVPGVATSLQAVGFLEGYRDSINVSKTIESSDIEGGIIIEVPGTIDNLMVVQDSPSSFSASYIETGDEEKTVQWFMDGVEQTDEDNNDTFTYPGVLSEGRHQVMVKMTKAGITYANSLRFSAEDTGGIIVEVPGTIDNLMVVQDSPSSFSASYIETGDEEKTVQWFMDGVEQTDEDNNDTFTYPGVLSEGRHQVTVKITKGEKTFATSLRFSAEDTGGIIVEVPGIIENLAISRTSENSFTATYVEKGEGEKTITWLMDGIEQADSDNDDTFTYPEILGEERHQVTVKITKGEKTFATSLRFSQDDGSGSIEINIPGSIQNLEITQLAGLSFIASYTETGLEEKQIRWYMDGIIQDVTSNTMAYTPSLEAGRHQVMIEIIKGGKIYATTLRFTSYRVGDTGPAGGTIIQLNTDQTGGSWSYMEAAPADLEGTYTWSEALTACSTVTFNGFEDWILPSLSSMIDLFENQLGLNTEVSAWYWSSDDAAEGNKAWQIHSKTCVYEYYTKSAYNYVRPVRIF